MLRFKFCTKIQRVNCVFQLLTYNQSNKSISLQIYSLIWVTIYKILVNRNEDAVQQTTTSFQEFLFDYKTKDYFMASLKSLYTQIISYFVGLEWLSATDYPHP